MARRLIGLDIGTNAVRVAEVEAGTPPRITSFGQVALPLDAMREGEVADPAAVTAAVQRLFKELSLRKGDVRVGIASPRVLVRTVDLPAMSDDDLAGALQFQAQELIPIPLDDAVLDFQQLEALPEGPPGPDGAPPQAMTRVLLAAAHQDAVRGIVDAVRAAGLSVSAVDLVPLALVRSVGERVSEGDDGAEALVSVGGGVTVIVVHERGLPRFVRILGGGGRSLTDAIARDLELTTDQAETLKRQGARAAEDLSARATAAMARPLSDLVEQIRGSLDYYRTQPDAARLLRVTITGGGSLTPGLDTQLRDVTGLPVGPAQPREHLAIADIGFPSDQLPALDPFFPVPAGLALGGMASGRRVNLLGGEGKAADDRKRLIRTAVMAGAALVLLLGGVWFMRKSSLDDEKAKLAAAQAETSRLQQEAAKLNDAQATQTQVDTLRQQVQTLLAADVSWSRMLQEIARTIPSDTWLTGFQGTSTSSAAATAGAAAPVTPAATDTSGTTATTAAGETPTTPTTPTAPPPAVSGTVNFSVMGLDFTSVSAWIQRIGEQIPSFSNLWVPSASKGSSGSGGTTTTSATTTSGGRTLVTFTSTAGLTPAARSDRLEALDRETR